MKKLLIALVTLLVSGSAYAGDNKDLAGTHGTVTSWEDGKVLLVEVCEGDEVIGWDYPTCARVLRAETAKMLCKRGLGSYRWQFQVGPWKPLLDQVTSCKTG